MRKTAIKTTAALFALCVAITAAPIFAFAGDSSSALDADAENLRIDSVAYDEYSGALIVDVTNIKTGAEAKLEISLEDADITEQYITVTATDFEGNKSKSVKVPNPLYKPPSEEAPAEPGETTDGAPEGGGTTGNPFAPAPFTPDGTGEVVDNTTETEGEKEFFTITTKDGNVYYLIVDRQRDAQNVYFLNAVTEGDLLPLAEPETETVGEIPVATPTPTPTPAETPPATEQPATPEKPASGGTGRIFFVVIAVAAVGGIGYYVKIVKPKKNAFSDGGETNDNEKADYDDDWEDSDNDEYKEED